jgi:4-oxalocrotonate tautomerase
MPIIHVEMVTGRSAQQKRELVEALTRETARIAGCATSSVMVIIDDVTADNWSVGGQLIADKKPG